MGVCQCVCVCVLWLFAALFGGVGGFLLHGVVFIDRLSVSVSEIPPRNIIFSSTTSCVAFRPLRCMDWIRITPSWCTNQFGVRPSGAPVYVMWFSWVTLLWPMSMPAFFFEARPFFFSRAQQDGTGPLILATFVPRGRLGARFYPVELCPSTLEGLFCYCCCARGPGLPGSGNSALGAISARLWYILRSINHEIKKALKIWCLAAPVCVPALSD